MITPDSQAERDRRVRELFDAAVRADAAERKRLVRGLRETDPGGADELESLLECHEDDSGVLDRSPAQLSVIASAGLTGAVVGAPDRREPEPSMHGTLDPGTRVGPYTVSRLIGVGGMGVVYEAEQSSPRRRVALKLVRAELITRSMLHRFEQEAAALAALKHPYIAQIYEAGTVEVGGRPPARPFLAIELVEGQSLQRYAAGRALNTREKLELMAKVADAVQHAHQRGVIHRDLKPANIMVEVHDGSEGAAATPKILDFGVARLTETPSAAASLETAAGQIIGTLGYMSPEQASGDSTRVDTRTDVYALGAITYELLTGRRPLGQGGSSFEQVMKSMSEDRVEPPSRFVRELRGDVDTIVLKCVERDPNRRYASASELAADVRRFLSDEPVTARPPGTWYLLRKFAKRHRTLVLVVVIAGMALAGTMGGLAWSVVRARRAERSAFQEASRAKVESERRRKANEFIREMLSVTPTQMQGRDSALFKLVLDRAAEKAEAFSEDPATQGAVLAMLGDAYRSFGFVRDAQAMLERAAPLLEQSIGRTHRDTVDCLESLAGVLGDIGEYARAELLAKEVIGRYGAEDPDGFGARKVLASVYHATMRPAEAERVIDELYAVEMRVLGPDHPETISTMAPMAAILQHRGQTAEGSAMMAAAVAKREKLFGPDDRRTIDLLIDQAVGEQLVGNPETALRLALEAVSRAERSQGSVSDSTANAWLKAADLSLLLGEHAQAADLYRKIIRAGPELLGLGSYDPASLRSNAAFAMQRCGRAEEALEQSTLAVRLALEQRIAPGPVLGRVYFRHSESLKLLGRADEREQFLRKAYANLTLGSEAEPDNARAVAKELALQREMAGDMTGASTWWERSRQDRPEHAPAER